MEIKISFDAGKFHTSPDPAQVRQGESVTWRFVATKPDAPLEWMLYFTHGSPFGGQSSVLFTETKFDGSHSGITEKLSADHPGDYKYGIRLVDSSKHSILGDDDPRLVVLRK